MTASMSPEAAPDIAYLLDVDEPTVISRLKKNRGRYITWPGSQRSSLETSRRLRWLIRSGGALKALDEPVSVRATRDSGVLLKLSDNPESTTLHRIAPEAEALHDMIGGRAVVEQLRAEYDTLGPKRTGDDAAEKLQYWTKVSKLLAKTGASPYTLSRDMGLATHTVIHALQRHDLA